MKKLILACLPALLAIPSQAHANFPEWGTFILRYSTNGYNCAQYGGILAGPWYSYWPYEAHFISPAPTGYPYWPAPQTLPGQAFGVRPNPILTPMGPFAPGGYAPPPPPAAPPRTVQPA